MKILKSNLSEADKRLLKRIEQRWESVNATDSRQQLPSLVDEVRITGTRKVFQRRNLAVAALVSMQDLMRLEALDAKRDAEAAQQLDKIERNKDTMLSIDDVRAVRAAGLTQAAAVADELDSDQELDGTRQTHLQAD